MEKNFWPVTANGIRSSTNQELKEQLKIITVNRFIKSQRIQWLGHIMRRNAEAATKVVLDWKPEGKILLGCPRKRWIDAVEKNSEDLGARNLREIVQDRERWNNLVMAAKTLWRVIKARRRKMEIFNCKFNWILSKNKDWKQLQDITVWFFIKYWLSWVSFKQNSLYAPIT